ncbi:MAG: GTPase [Planctomycetota bacterium]
MDLRATVTTANQPGAVGIVQVSGEAERLTQLLNILTARSGVQWDVGRLWLCDFAGIDSGLAGRVSETTAQLMPHGGLRVVQKIEAWLREQGVEAEKEIDTRVRYPEAASRIEADVLHAIATASSPAAIDLLAEQPRLWKAWLETNPKSEIRNPKSRSHLLTPPTVVVVGRPNVGKSTLLNRLTGRSSAVVADLPGTTRDWVGGLVELVPPGGDASRDAVAVRWLDTPGLRSSDDAVEQRAILQARAVVENADVLIAMRDPENGWPEVAELPREPDLWVVNKADAGALPEGERDAIHISAKSGDGVSELAEAVLERLGVSTIERGRPWVFSQWLQSWAEGDRDPQELERYVSA